MKDKGLDMGLIRELNTSERNKRGWSKNFYGFRKMFHSYLNKLEVPFYDICCAEASENPGPVRFNVTTGSLEYFNGTAWVETVGGFGAAATGITAFAGGGQGSATALTAGYNEVTTVATAGDSVKLPTAAASTVVIVKNEGAAAMNVFPFLGDTINDGSANAAYAVPAGATVTFVALNATNWETDSELVIASGIKNSAGTMIAAFYPQVAQTNITAGTGGAIPVTNYLTTINTDAGGDAFTLAAGTQVGQMKKILLVADGGGDGVVTPAALAAGTTITFNDATDYVILQWNGAAWVTLENSGTTIA
jgi:hypothetical protein